MERHYGSSQGKANHAEGSLVHRGCFTTTRMLKTDLDVAFPKSAGHVHHIFNVESEAEHSRMRRVLGHGFSEKAVREQEPLIQGYVDLLIRSLHEAVVEGPQNVVSWYSFVAFDIIGMQEVIFN